MNETNQLALPNPTELMRHSTDISALCKQIVVASAMDIQGRKYVRVEGWQSIATAHGCVASSRDVERVEGGYRAIGEIRRMNDGAILAQAEGFVGEDETTWFGGPAMVWDKATRQRVEKVLEKRPDYAIRAMAQTRAISRACRSAFAHIVVLMDAGLQTTPAEEVPPGGFDNHDDAKEDRREQEAREVNAVKTWKDAVCHIGKKDGPLKGKTLGELPERSLLWLYEQLTQKEPTNTADKHLKAAVLLWKVEQDNGGPVKQKVTTPPPESDMEAFYALLDQTGLTNAQFFAIAQEKQWVSALTFEGINAAEADWMVSHGQDVIAACVKGAAK